ncbi:hypothetical protein [Lacibacter sp.]|uniref:hypothetical protein n=1 Tax=Lacibacter sp. TaxID=1915409 RepID=UPI002B4AD53B|nr:hypothetical protein [Lacibacter sp.]HLP36736.1 hypothetical protein [Lacibacter sp.]
MKITKRYFLFLLAVSVFSACKKDSNIPAFTIEGSWVGKLGSGSNTPGSQFEINVKPGGVLERINGNGGISGIGTWQVNGDTFTGHYEFTNSNGSASVQATIDKAANKLVNGTWGSGNNTSGAGTWYASKEN